MTFEEFQATKHAMTQDAYNKEYGINQDYFAHDTTILVYATGLYIEDLGEEQEDGRYYLLIENADWKTDDLESLEKCLYEYGCESECLGQVQL